MSDFPSCWATRLMVSVHFVLRVSIPRVKKNVADENQAAAAVIPDVSLFFFKLCVEKQQL